ncbi:GmrSD restriction endonuclease domain-containing protein [Dermabacteraceae bacterium P13088]
MNFSDGDRTEKSALRNETWNMVQIFTAYTNKRLRVNRRYQRKLVWKPAEKSLLIDSLQRGYPIPSIILRERVGRPGAPFEIIDGMQRLEAICGYMEQRVRDAKGKFFDVTQFPPALEWVKKINGEDYEPLSNEEVDASATQKFFEFNVNVSIIPDVEDDILRDIFSKINGSGRRISNQERRQAGVDTRFSRIVNELASFYRHENASRDSSLSSAVSVRYSNADIAATEEVPKGADLHLGEVRKISVRGQRESFGNSVDASETFWVKNGVLNVDGLRSSQDEKVLADILGCILRRKSAGKDSAFEGPVLGSDSDALDALYDVNSDGSRRAEDLILDMGYERLVERIRVCIDLISSVLNSKENPLKLQRLLYSGTQNKPGNSNPFPTAFALFVVAIYGMSYESGNGIVKTIPEAKYAQAYDAFDGLFTHGNLRVDLRKKTGKDRGETCDLIARKLDPLFIKVEAAEEEGYRNSRRLEALLSTPCENAVLEFKQGTLSLEPSRPLIKVDEILKTLCAISNIKGSEAGETVGTLILGVADKRSDADRVFQLDRVPAVEYGGHFVVGVDREFPLNSKLSGCERYLHFWRDKIGNSVLHERLRASLCEKMYFAVLRGKSVLVIPVPWVGEYTWFGGTFYRRDGDQTKEVNLDEAKALGWIKLS